MPDISILMPVFNERARLEAAIEDALGAELPVTGRQLVVVDDGSTDGTRELLREGSWPDNVLVLEHDRNRVKGQAVRTALSHATGDFSAILDADLEYEAARLAGLLEPLMHGRTNVVFSTRAWASHSAYSF
jgi:glycosyltransferase involved in cell wall biosynthesis